MSGKVFMKEKKGAIHVAKRELKNERMNRAFQYLFLLFSLVSALTVVAFFAFDYFDITGYASSVDSKGGSVTLIDITHRFPTNHWAGIFGFALRVPGVGSTVPFKDIESGTIGRMDALFECVDLAAPGEGPELFVSTDPNLDFNNVTPLADLSVIDDYTGCLSVEYCATNTFTDSMTIFIGEAEITGIPSTFTYKHDGSNEIFKIGAINVSGSLAFVTIINSTFQEGYNPNVTVNYQALLPTPPNSNVRHYFYVDPFDDCPGGGIGSSINATAHGYVFDNLGSVVENSTVTVAGYSTKTDVLGFYNVSFLVLPGTYHIIATKDGYDPAIDNVTVNFSVSVVEKNLTLVPETTGTGGLISPIVFGIVRDDSGSALAGANISLGDGETTSNSTGHYSFQPNVPIGRSAILAFKTGYDNYFAFLDFNETTLSLEHNITMEEANFNPFETGPFETGPFEEEARREAELEGIDYWVSTKEIDRVVRTNTFIEEKITIFNFRSSQMPVTFTISPEIEDFVKIDRSSLTIAPNSDGEAIVTIFGTRPVGLHTGNIDIGGSIEQDIPVTIEIVDRNFPLESLFMNLELFREAYSPGSNVKYRLVLQNFLMEQNYKVFLNYTLVDRENVETFYTSSEEVEVRDTLTLLRDFDLPEDIEDGDYILKAEGRYLGESTGVLAFLTVRTPLYLYAFFGIPLWIIFLIISFLSFMVFNFFFYKAYKNKKKRYHLTLNKNLLPTDGPRSIKLGKLAETNIPAYYNLDSWTTHGIIAGATGGGKSVSAQVIIEEALLKGMAVIVFDPTAQWSGMLRKCEDKKMMSLYPKFGLKPSDAKAFPGNVKMIKDPRQKIDIGKYMNPGQIQILALNKLDPSDMDIFVASVIVSIFRSSPEEHPGLRTLLVFDEVHRLLPKFGGSGKGFLQIERACREFRKWGFGVMLVSQVLSDFVGEIKANINTEVQMRVAEEKDLERIKERYGLDALKSLVKADIGVGMVQNAEFNRGLPYFVAFRPLLHSTRRLSDEILDKYNHYGDIIEDLEYQIEQLETEKVDTFDLKMELKLVKDKLMTGNFTVVDIYLEGLIPRFEKQWETLGKKPKKKELELVEQKDIEASLADAQKERDKLKEKEKKEGAQAKGEEKKEDILTKIVKSLTFDNGMAVSSLKELKDVLPGLDKDVFAIHVNKDKNQIADWVEKEIDPALGAKLKGLTEKEKMVAALNEKPSAAKKLEVKKPGEKKTEAKKGEEKKPTEKTGRKDPKPKEEKSADKANEKKESKK